MASAVSTRPPSPKALAFRRGWFTSCSPQADRQDSEYQHGDQDVSRFHLHAKALSSAVSLNRTPLLKLLDLTGEINPAANDRLESLGRETRNLDGVLGGIADGLDWVGQGGELGLHPLLDRFRRLGGFEAAQEIVG